MSVYGGKELTASFRRAQLMRILCLAGGVPHLTRERQSRAAAQAAALAPKA